MFSKTLPFVLFFIFVLSGQAADTYRAPEIDDDFKYYELYRAQYGNKTVYIHGTMHNRNPDHNPDILNNNIHKATAIFTECFDSLSKDNDADHLLDGLEEKIMKKQDEPEWVELFKKHPFLYDDNKLGNLYDYFEKKIKSKYKQYN
jgi:hypothetical protein